jgi:hypothetical protein
VSAKTITARGHQVTVDHVTINHPEGLVAWHFTAKTGQTEHHYTVTVGPIDCVTGQIVAPPTAAEMQKMLDDHRAIAADHAAWKEIVRLNAQGLK